MSPTFTGEDGSVNPRLCSSRVSSKGAIRSGLAPCRAANLEINLRKLWNTALWTKSPAGFVFKMEHSGCNVWYLLSLSKDLGVWTQRGSRVCARRRSPQTSCRTYLKIRLQRSRSDKSSGKASGKQKELWKATWNNTFTWVFLVKNALEFKSNILHG